MKRIVITALAALTGFLLTYLLFVSPMEKHVLLLLKTGGNVFGMAASPELALRSTAFLKLAFGTTFGALVGAIASKLITRSVVRTADAPGKIAEEAKAE